MRMSSIVVLTNSFDDAHVNAVADPLRELGHEVIRMNTDKILLGDQSIVWDYQSGGILLETHDEENCVDLSSVDSVWYRKPFGFGRLGFAEIVKDPIQRNVVESEVRHIIDGLCMALGSKLWVNHPIDIYRARLKPFQLQIARSIGLNVPDSIITNDPREAREFCAAQPTVFKMLASQSVEYRGTTYSVDTTLVTPGLMAKFDFIRSQPVLLQRYIDKHAELRVTYVNGEVLVARQTLSCDVSTVDWRSLQNCRISKYEAWHVSSTLVMQLQLLMRSLNLKFAAIDFVVDGSGMLWFLEVNPNGQWLGYTNEIGMPAAKFMAELLVP